MDSVVRCGTGVAVCAGAALTGICIDNSIIVNSRLGAPSDTVTQTKCGFEYTLISPQQTALPGRNILRNQDPLFVDPANENYRLSIGSPAVDAADPAVVNSVDLEGTSRPQGAANDLGAFELVK